MRRFWAVLLGLQMLLVGIVPRADVHELVRATAVWNQHRVSEHAEVSLLAFVYDHFVAHSHDDPTGAHRDLALNPGASVVWAIVSPPLCLPAMPVAVPAHADAARVLCGHVVEAARQGVGQPLWRPPQAKA